MNIPLNGRIAIVDDKYEEVKPLIRILSKKRIPFNYYTGLRATDLPENPDINPLTLIFLDLNIVETQHSVKSVISTLNPILKALCPSKSKPYFLVIWSKKINEFADALDKHFKTYSDLKNRKPVKTVRLDKSDFFSLQDGKYLFDDTKYDLLVSKLKESIENISVLNNFFAWENVVHQETTETINEFSAFFEINSDWDKNTKAIIFHLAKAMSGEEEVSQASEENKLVMAFYSINSFLSDKVQNSIQKNILGEITNIKDDLYSKKNRDGSLKNGIRGKLNSKLHLSELNLGIDSFQQGNIYKIRNENDLVKRILDKDKFGNVSKEDILKSKPSLIQLDLTPVCDYAQDKQYTRLLYGLLIDATLYPAEFKGAYRRTTPIFNIAGKDKFMLFDYRFIKTMTKEEIKRRKKPPFLRLRKELCTDIQSEFSNQVNRPGISNV